MLPWPLCSIYSNNSHVGWLADTWDTIFKIVTLWMLQTNFVWNCHCGFKEDFKNSLCWRDRQMNDDRWQLMLKAQLTIWVKWAKKTNSSQIWYLQSYLYNQHRGPVSLVILFLGMDQWWSVQDTILLSENLNDLPTVLVTCEKTDVNL